MTLPPLDHLTPICTPTQKKNFSFPQVLTHDKYLSATQCVECSQVSQGAASIPATASATSFPINKSSHSQTAGKRSELTIWLCNETS